MIHESLDFKGCPTTRSTWATIELRGLALSLAFSIEKTSGHLSSLYLIFRFGGRAQFSRSPNKIANFSQVLPSSPKFSHFILSL